ASARGRGGHAREGGAFPLAAGPLLAAGAPAGTLDVLHPKLCMLIQLQVGPVPARATDDEAYQGRVSVRLRMAPVDSVDPELRLVDLREEGEEVLVPRPDRLLAAAAAPAKHVLREGGIDALLSLPGEAASHVGRVQRQDVIEPALPEIRRQMTMKLGVERIDDGSPGLLPSVRDRAPRADECDGRRRCRQSDPPA